MIKQHSFNEHKCDYCEGDCFNAYSTQVDGKWFNGHKRCMLNLKSDYEHISRTCKEIEEEIIGGKPNGL